MAHTNGMLDAARQTRLEALGVVWGTSAEQRWERNFALLKAFREREGGCEVPVAHEEEGVKLGEWLVRQRHAHTNCKLDAARQTRLEALGVVWGTSAEQRWGRNFALLKAFSEREGGCEVPVAHEEEGVKLGEWLVRQRAAHTNGKLDAARQTQLEALGVVWGTSAEQRRGRNIVLLKAFSEREGGCEVPVAHEEEGVKLGEWLVRQRAAHTNGKLDAARQTQLEALGVVWGTSAEQRRGRNIALLKAFSEREGGCMVPARHEEEGVKLRHWLVRQRAAHTNGKLDAARQTQLEALGVVWGTSAEQRRGRNIALLKAFSEREGGCKVPVAHEEEGVKLRHWLGNQR